MNYDVQFQLNGNHIRQCQHITHLGHTVETDRQPRVDINKGISDLIMRTNYVMSKFGCCSADFRNFLFMTYYLAPDGVARYCFHPVCLCVILFLGY